MQRNKSAASPSLGKRKVEFRVRAAVIRDLIKRSDLLLPVRLRKCSITPKGCKCAELLPISFYDHH